MRRNNETKLIIMMRHIIGNGGNQHTFHGNQFYHTITLPINFPIYFFSQCLIHHHSRKIKGTNGKKNLKKKKKKQM